MLKVYPAIFHKEEGAYWVEFPDLEGCQSCGDTIEKVMELSQEALGLYLVYLIENGIEIPPASEFTNIETDNFTFVSYISTDVTKYMRNNKAVKKTISMPAWLAEEAERNNISLSNALQERLKEQLGF